MAEIYDKNGELLEAYDSEGNPIDEVKTPEEIAQQIQDAKEEAEAEHQTQLEKIQEEKDEAKEALKAMEESLEKEKDKDKNFGKLRGAALEKEKEVQAQKDKIEELSKKFEGLEATSKAQPVNMRIKEVAGGDEELEKKIKFHYNSFATPEEDTEELQKERIKNATILATGGEKQADPLTGGVVASGGGVAPGGVASGETGKLSDSSAKNVGKKMGLTDKEMKDL